MKILVRAPNWIGDSILAVPAIHSLSQNHPEAEIWVAAKGWVKDLFISYSFIKGIVSLPDRADLKNLLRTAQELKGQDFDTGLLLTNSFGSALLFALKFLGVIQIPLLDRIAKADDHKYQTRFAGVNALVMGVVFAAGWSLAKVTRPLMILGAVVVFLDLLKKTYFLKKSA